MKLTSNRKSVVIRRKEYPRIPYGSEPGAEWRANEGSCHDCGATKGQLHAVDCDVERCPRCREQAISCGCENKSDAQLRPAQRNQVRHLVRLGCNKTWAQGLNVAQAKAEILNRDPVEAELLRQSLELQERHQLEKRQLRNQHKNVRSEQWRLHWERDHQQNPDPRRIEEEWLVHFG
jgi:hypothetical protein